MAWQLAEVGAHADLFENCGCFLCGRSQGHARCDQGDGRVLRRSQRWQKIVLLKNKTHGTAAKGYLLRARQLSDRYAARLDHSSGGAEDAGDDRDEGSSPSNRRKRGVSARTADAKRRAGRSLSAARSAMFAICGPD